MCLAIILPIRVHLASWSIGCPPLVATIVHHHVVEHLLTFIVVALGSALVRLHHERDFLCKLQQIYAVFWVSTHDLRTLDVGEIVLENFFAE